MSLEYVQSSSTSYKFKYDVILYQIYSMVFPDMLIYNDVKNVSLSDVWTKKNQIPDS